MLSLSCALQMLRDSWAVAFPLSLFCRRRIRVSEAKCLIQGRRDTEGWSLSSVPGCLALALCLQRRMERGRVPERGGEDSAQFTVICKAMRAGEMAQWVRAFALQT